MKHIIILDRTGEPSDLSFSCLFWLSVPAGREKFYTIHETPALPFSSRYQDATAEEIAALKAGTVIEMTENIVMPAGTPLTTIQARVIVRYNELQNALNSRNPFVRYGTSWDGASWTVGGVS